MSERGEEAVRRVAAKYGLWKGSHLWHCDNDYESSRCGCDACSGVAALREIWAEAAAEERRAPKHGIYIASKTKHAERWKRLRADGWPIISTWIDEAGIGETKSFEDLWLRCIGETAKAERMIVYAEPGDELKGALVEVGAALQAGTPVFVVGNIEPLKTAKHHPLIRFAATIEDAKEFVIEARQREDG